MDTPENNRFGLLSISCGTSALICFLFLAHLAYLDKLGLLVGGKTLAVFDGLGLVSQKKSYIVELKTSSIFSLNDSNVIVWLTCLAFALALSAVVLALYADHKQESTLYPGAGFIVASLGPGLLYPVVTPAVQVAGFLILFAIRRYRVAAKHEHRRTR